MEKINSQLEIIGNFVNNVLRKKNIVILVGSNGIKIVVYYKDEVIDSIFIDYKEKEYFTICCTFLNGYKKSQILILLDSKDCQIKHEFMPMLQSIVKSNPVEKFLQDNYKPEDITAYNIYNVNNDNRHGELWETTIASTTYSCFIEQLLEFIIHNSFKFIGIYFLSLEFESIIGAILKTQNSSDSQNDLQIFATITEASSIRVATKYKKNILDESSVEFPSEKSDHYIAGTIEQAISDQILKFKAYAKSLDIKICLIFLCDKILCDILEKMPSLQVNKIITYNSNSRIIESGTTHFQDRNLLELFMKNKKYLASNKSLKSITTLTTLNSLLFKPLFLIAAGIVIFLSFLKYQSVLTQKETMRVNNQYYLLSEQYRNIKKRYPEINNITNLVELYNLEKLVSVKSLNPSDFLKKLFSINTPNIEVISINWYTEDINVNNKKILLTFDLLYLSEKKERKVAEDAFLDCVNKITMLFQDYQVTYTIEYDGIIELPKLLTIPARIILSKKTVGV